MRGRSRSDVRARVPGAPRSSHVVLWATRAAWLVVAIVGGTAIGDALADDSRSVQVVGTVGAWLGWAAGAGALAIASVTTLTAARTVIPASVIVAVAVLVGGADPGSGVSLLAPATAASALVGSAEFGRIYIQSSAYGDESRFGLRPPLGYLAACAGSWLVTTAALVIAPLAWAAGAWIAALVTTAVAGGGLALFPRRWHQLSRRWLVLVPAGVVLHDPVVLADTLMMPARLIESIELDDLGVAAQRAADLSGPTPGLGVEIRLVEQATAVLAATPSKPDGTAIHLQAVLVSPTRPGSVIVAAHHRGLPKPA